MQQILPLPIKFDENEWFILLNIIVGYTVVSFLPKRYPRAISVLVVLFCVSLAIILDHAIASPPLNLYDINDQKKYELMDVITYFIYSPYALITVYLYDKLRPKGLYYTAYVVGWSLFCLLFEWLAEKCHVFTYEKWNLVYSFSVYLAATPLHLWFFRFILGYFQASQKKSA
ncbi:MAG: putative rane protein [Bacilli bacterium]|nr:putative rane protein [Bacilli bacterium]